MSRSVVPVALWIGLLPFVSAIAVGQTEDPDREPDDRLGLADLAAYRAALSGRATADEARSSDPPASVGFRDLWAHPQAYRGRRVTVVGRLERSFRQGPVGSFPPLVEAWLFSTAGDPLCVVYPRNDATTGLDPGRAVRFTGTFLKMVRYTSGDGDRLAPLIVGDRPLAHHPPEAGKGSAATPTTSVEILRAIGGGGRADSPGANRTDWMPSSWVLGFVLTAVAAVVIAGQHLRGARLRDRAAARRGLRDHSTSEPPLRFVDPAGDRS